MDQREPAPLTLPHFIDSIFIIISGYFLKFVLAQAWGIFITGVNGTWSNASFLDTARFLLYVYLEFSGYSLIALGIGRLIGVPTPVNFNYPYLATSLSEFWTRWHMSLGIFVRNSIYTPLQVFLMRNVGRKNRKLAYYVNLFALWVPFIFVALWHRLSLSFLLWGLSVGLIVAFEKYFRDRFLNNGNLETHPFLRLMLKLFGVIYTMTIVISTLNIASKEFFVK